jgi:hypothetical protein
LWLVLMATSKVLHSVAPAPAACCWLLLAAAACCCLLLQRRWQRPRLLQLLMQLYLCGKWHRSAA